MRAGARALAVEGEEEVGGRSAEPSRPRQDEASVTPLCLDTLYREESPGFSAPSPAGRRAARMRGTWSMRFSAGWPGWGSRLASARASPAYLSRIATNLLRDRAKHASRHMTASHVAADENKLAGIDQQRLLESRDMLTRVEEAMLKLRPKTREIFMAHRIDGLSYAEIAERTGLSIKGVEKQMSKAIAQIDRMLDRD